jgi:hypothetical protein
VNWIRYKNKAPVNMANIIVFHIVKASIVFYDVSGGSVVEWSFSNINEANNVSDLIMKKIGILKL